MILEQYKTAGEAITHYIMNADRPAEQAAALVALFAIVDAKPRRPKAKVEFIFELTSNTPAAKMHLYYFHIIAGIMYDAIAKHANGDTYKLALIALFNEMAGQFNSLVELNSVLNKNQISIK
jgi:hypothetical protein